ncbi:DNA-3-methyladenine glycosylase family protein [Granulosicoccus antarcticus]|uniref:DNA-3-methyladenine glycosylase II n=1 Tax=Granulosicoccus antarcticus IMCC3135 TaxID=1192854 RepID=A0A2Z2NUR3_9GAMM|nr:DNA-3-methyladenine glycosylase [Granulosicoccus antarcticus]ASJ71407.1 DNA-3-methyladenine glycosylase [Granulosicoccus antarcticus IMCC3135]
MTDVETSLTRNTLAIAVQALTREDPLICGLVRQYGMPPLWQRSQSFATLVHIILEQKVSLASAKAVMLRVQKLCPQMNHKQFLGVSEQRLRQVGISERKLSYCRSIAEAIDTGELDLSHLRRCTDAQVMDALTSIRGIGPWSAGVYLLMALRRPDAWASGDRALVVSLAECADLPAVPGYAELDQWAERWRPYRAAAARVLWHAYLSRRSPGARQKRSS